MKQQRHICDSSRQTAHISLCHNRNFSQLQCSTKHHKPKFITFWIAKKINKSCLDCWNGRLNMIMNLQWNNSVEPTMKQLGTYAHSHTPIKLNRSVKLHLWAGGKPPAGLNQTYHLTHWYCQSVHFLGHGHIRVGSTVSTQRTSLQTVSLYSYTACQPSFLQLCHFLFQREVLP